MDLVNLADLKDKYLGYFGNMFDKGTVCFKDDTEVAC